MTTPLRLGIVGLGAVAQAVYLPLLARNRDRFEIAAIADLSPGLRTTIGERLGLGGAALFDSGEALLGEAAIDAVLLLASGSHGALVEAALRRGVPALCEKPLAYTLAEIDRLLAFPASTKRVLLAYMKLHDPALERAVELTRDRPPLRSIEITILHPTARAQLAHARLLPPPTDVPQNEVAATAATLRAQRETALGNAPAWLGPLYTEVLIGSIVHDLALMRALAGDPAWIDHADVWPDHDLETGGPLRSVSIAGRLADGARFSIGWHYLDRYPAFREQVRRHDAAGTIALGFPSPYLLNAPTDLSFFRLEEGAAAETRFRSVEEAFERQLASFEAMCRDGTPPKAGIAEGRTDVITALRMAVAVARSRGVELAGEAAGVADRVTVPARSPDLVPM